VKYANLISKQDSLASARAKVIIPLYIIREWNLDDFLGQCDIYGLNCSKYHT